MPRFKGIVEKVTLTLEEMEKSLTIPSEEIDDWSPIKVKISPDRKTLHRTFARSIAETIRANNAVGKPTKLILPVGPAEQYQVLAEISNREKTCWKNVWTFNIDEYSDWQGRSVSEDQPMSFKGLMKRHLFDLLKKRGEYSIKSHILSQSF